MFDVLKLALLEHFNSKVDKYVTNCQLTLSTETLALLGIPKEKGITPQGLHLQARTYWLLLG